MNICKLYMCFAEIKPCNHTNAIVMTFLKKIPEKIIGQIRACLLEIQLCRIKSRNSSAAHHTYICAELFEIIDVSVHIHSCVDITQIILYHSKTLFLPPIHLFLPPQQSNPIRPACRSESLSILFPKSHGQGNVPVQTLL